MNAVRMLSKKSFSHPCEGEEAKESDEVLS